MQRYYNQPYSRVDAPPDASQNIDMEQFREADDHPGVDTEYHPYGQSQPSAYEPYRQTQTLNEPSAPAQVEDSPPLDGKPQFTPVSMDKHNPAQRSRPAWSKRRKCVIFGASAVAIIVILGLVIGLAVGLTVDRYDYTPSYVHVTNQAAFASGGATHNNVEDMNDGIGPGQDTYTYYTGTAANFPNSSSWISFGDMWNGNLNILQNSCEELGFGPNNTPQIDQDIYDAIQNRANASLVDHRFILAVIIQESSGCVRIPPTKSSSGVNNPGIMQSHDGVSWSASHSNKSILAMVQDGTQGTKAGSGLVQNLNLYGNPYKAARGYNSGYIPKDGNLSASAGATGCYVSDIANRLTGWLYANSTCPGESDN